jgi:predicted metal-binding membrane protein
MSTIAARLRLPRPAVLAAIAAAWIVAAIAQSTGRGSAVHHDALLVDGPPVWLAVALFIVSWQVMIAAMMLPSSLPLIGLFDAASSSLPRRGRTLAAFLGGYALVWTSFGLAAFAGDAALHALVRRTPWLALHPYVIGASVLAGAGLFQFSSLKDRCLDQCRHPAAFLVRHYDRGTRAALRLGRAHGLFCLGCCWALMLVGFAVGVANLSWMALLTLLMVFEKTGRGGDRGVVPIGVGLIAFGGAVALQPAWLQPALAALGLR